MVPCLELVSGAEKNNVNLSLGSSSKSRGAMPEDYHDSLNHSCLDCEVYYIVKY